MRKIAEQGGFIKGAGCGGLGKKKRWWRRRDRDLKEASSHEQSKELKGLVFSRNGPFGLYNVGCVS